MYVITENFIIELFLYHQSKLSNHIFNCWKLFICCYSHQHRYLENKFYPRWYVRTTQRCFVVVVVVGVTDIAQNTALLSNFTMLSAYYTIACTFAR
jgi:hypothetical protein